MQQNVKFHLKKSKISHKHTFFMQACREQQDGTRGILDSCVMYDVTTRCQAMRVFSENYRKRVFFSSFNAESEAILPLKFRPCSASVVIVLHTITWREVVLALYFNFNAVLSSPANNASGAWLGLHDRLLDGRYTWVDGSPVPFIEWAGNEPDGESAQNCVEQSNKDLFGGWADESCSNKIPFVCKVVLPGECSQHALPELLVEFIWPRPVTIFRKYCMVAWRYEDL